MKKHKELDMGTKLTIESDVQTILTDKNTVLIENGLHGIDIQKTTENFHIPVQYYEEMPDNEIAVLLGDKPKHDNYNPKYMGEDGLLRVIMINKKYFDRLKEQKGEDHASHMIRYHIARCFGFFWIHRQAMNGEIKPGQFLDTTENMEPTIDAILDYLAKALLIPETGAMYVYRTFEATINKHDMTTAAKMAKTANDLFYVTQEMLTERISDILKIRKYMSK